MGQNGPNVAKKSNISHFKYYVVFGKTSFQSSRFLTSYKCWNCEIGENGEIGLNGEIGSK